MIAYLIRRILYAVPILIGVNFLTFALFFFVSSPDDIARFQLGQKHVTEEAVERWKREHGYDKPLFFNREASGMEGITETIFFEKSLKLFVFEFGLADDGRDISEDVRTRMWPSLAFAVPTFLVGLGANITFALIIVFFRATKLDLYALMGCIVLMSISSLFYIIAGQYVVGQLWRWVPISGYAPGFSAWRFLALPIAIGVLSGIGVGTRWYRTIFLEEIHRDYVRTARSKGLSELSVLFKHVLRNALLPILTGVVVVIPTLFLGSLIMESFFGIPGLGSYTIEAIHSQDFSIVRSMVFLGSVLYILGLLLTDVSYAVADPRVRLS